MRLTSAARTPEPMSLLERIARLPVGPPLTDEERAMIEASRASGPPIPHEVIEAELAERCRRGE